MLTLNLKWSKRKFVLKYDCIIQFFLYIIFCISYVGKQFVSIVYFCGFRRNPYININGILTVESFCQPLALGKNCCPWATSPSSRNSSCLGADMINIVLKLVQQLSATFTALENILAGMGVWRAMD